MIQFLLSIWIKISNFLMKKGSNKGETYWKKFKLSHQKKVNFRERFKKFELSLSWYKKN